MKMAVRFVYTAIILLFAATSYARTIDIGGHGFFNWPYSVDLAPINRAYNGTVILQARDAAGVRTAAFCSGVVARNSSQEAHVYTDNHCAMAMLRIQRMYPGCSFEAVIAGTPRTIRVPVVVVRTPGIAQLDFVEPIAKEVAAKLFPRIGARPVLRNSALQTMVDAEYTLLTRFTKAGPAIQPIIMAGRTKNRVLYIARAFGVYPGMSGSPVVDRAGVVVGLLYGYTTRSYSFALIMFFQDSPWLKTATQREQDPKNPGSSMRDTVSE